MSDELQNIPADPALDAVPEKVTPEVSPAPVATPSFADRPRGRILKKNPRKPSRNTERTKPEFDQKIIDIRRVTRVVAGGRRFSFSVALVAGDRKGRVGVGLGKAGDTSQAIEKAFRSAKKHMIRVVTTPSMSVPYEVDAKYSASRVIIRPAKGRGVAAGSTVRHVIELAGLNDVNAKLLSPSKNRLNNARATFKALSLISNHRKAKAK